MPARPSAAAAAGDGKRDDRRWFWALLLVAAVWRTIHLLTVRHSPLFDLLFIDPRMYDEWAARIAAGHLLGDAPFFLDPLYPYFVGGIYALFGRSLLAVAAIQSLLGALVPALLYLAARPWLGRTVARLAGLVAVFYPLSVYWGGVLMKPAVALFCVALALWLLSRACSRDRWPSWLGAGLALGLAGLSRGQLLLAIPVVAAFVAGSAIEATGRRRWRAAGLLLCGALLAVLPATAHNLAASGEVVLSTTNWGQIFYIGNNAANPNGRFQELPFVRSDPSYEQVDFRAEAERRVGSPLSHRAVSRFWFAEGLGWARSHPGDWARLMASKLKIFWGAYETPASLDYYLYRRYAPLLRLPLPGFGLLGPFALLGCVLAWPLGAWPRWVVVLVVTTALAVSTFFVLTRFRVVVLPAMIVLAAFGAVELARRLRAAARGGPRRPALTGLALLLLFGGFVNLPVQATADSWRYRVAAALHLPRRLETTARAHWNLGVSYAARANEGADPAAELRRAEEQLRAALLEETQAATYVELGKVLARLQRNGEAITAFQAAATLEPLDFRTHHSLGRLYRRVGDLVAAQAAFERALALFPRHTTSLVQLGEVLLARGRPAEAAERFRSALQQDPDLRAAREGLAAAAEREPD